jgi:excisionase family DNA binding protein
MTLVLPPVQRMTYTIEEVATMLHVSETTARRLARADELPVPVFRLGKQYRVSAPALDALLAPKPVDDVAQIEVVN